MEFDIDLDPNYKEVPERIAEFYEKYPDGRLRPMDEARPFWFETVDNQLFLVYAAAAYRDAEDKLPGIGMAWEPCPGRTPYTKLSELQNAETSAWGRAIVSIGASRSKSVSSAEDVRNRADDHQAPAAPPQHYESQTGETPTDKQMGLIRRLIEELGMSTDEARKDATKVAGREVKHLTDLTKFEASRLIDLWKSDE